jgi:hypothetical protein
MGDATVYDNTAENLESLGLFDTPARVLGEDPQLSKYVVHNTRTGCLIFTNERPLLNVPITDTHAREKCKVGQGHDCCRYLTMSSGGWSCEKFGDFRRLLDQRVVDEEIVARGDNCEGRQP